MINPDGTNEIALPVRRSGVLHEGGLVPGVWSPDHLRLVVGHLVADSSAKPGAETAWIRPATVNANGSGYTVLDAAPGRKMQLSPIGWSHDGSRILAYSGGEDVEAADMGLYSLRASDGSDLTRVMVTPPGYNDTYLMSPDQSKILVNRSTNDDDRALFVIDADGSGRVDVTGPDLIAEDLEFYDAISADWSPDGLHFVFAAGTSPEDPPGLYTYGPGYARPHQIVGPEVGAVTAQWQPALHARNPQDRFGYLGPVIAFTSKLRAGAQIWVVQANGAARWQLTDGADGSTSVAPVWSPDGTKLLFQRKRNNTVTLWTMNADGTEQKQLSPTPLASDYVGGYAWWQGVEN